MIYILFIFTQCSYSIIRIILFNHSFFFMASLVCFYKYFSASLTRLVGSRRLLPYFNKFLKKLVASVLVTELFTELLLPALVVSLIALTTLEAAVFIYFSKYLDYYSIVIYYFCIFFACGAKIISSYDFDISIFTTESFIKPKLSYPIGMNMAS